jgi:hypothetical protein
VTHLRKRLTYANVMSSIAVFLVLGGGAAFAAAQLGKNTVGTKQLKNNAVTTAKVKKEAISSAKLQNGAVTNGKLAADAVTDEKLAANAVTNGKLAADAVTGDKVKDNSLTGADVNASTLGQVPSSKKADTATKTENVLGALVHEVPGGEALPTSTTIAQSSEADVKGGSCFLGVCPVTFNRDISNCVATGSDASQTAGTLGTAAFVEVAIVSPNTVDAIVYNKKGATPVAENFSHDFSVTVVCPT